MTTLIYIAGASAELERVERANALARGYGLELSADWCASVRAARKAGKRSDLELTRDEREHALALCAGGVARAAWFLLLVPRLPSVGAWVELGIAITAPGSRRIALAGYAPVPSIFVVNAEINVCGDVDEPDLADELALEGIALREVRL